MNKSNESFVIPGVSIFAWCCKSVSTISDLPYVQALCKGVKPQLFAVFALAPFLFKRSLVIAKLAYAQMQSSFIVKALLIYIYTNV